MVSFDCAFSKSDFHMLPTGTVYFQKRPVPTPALALSDDPEKGGKLPGSQCDAVTLQLL